MSDRESDLQRSKNEQDSSGTNRKHLRRRGTPSRRILLKFFLIFTVTITLTSLLSGFLMNNLVRSYMLDSKKDDMEQAIGVLGDLWVETLESKYNALDSESNWVSQELKAQYDNDCINLLKSMELYEALLGTGAYIFMTSMSGEIEFAYPLTPNSDRYSANRKIIPWYISDNLMWDGERYFFRNSEQFLTVLADEELHTDTGDFHGLYSSTSSSYLTTQKRIDYLQSDTKLQVVAGAVTVSVPIPNVVQAQRTVVSYFVVSSIIAVLVELIVLIYFTKRLTDPLRELQEAAARIAEGDFTKKIVRHSNDEIGALVDSFNKMSEALANLDNMRNDFIANVSHELRTPMTSIGGFIDGIREGVIPPEKQDHYLGIVRDEITRMNALVNELLDMARLQSGRVTLDFRQYDVNEVARASVEKLEPILREKGLKASLNFKNKAEMAWFDKASVDRVFINLIQNAVKFTNSGGTITVHTMRVKDAVQVTVEDTGKGIPEDEQSLIFERFYKSDKSRGLDKKGTGLGLSLVKSILQAHGQKIWLESAVGVGSKFIFTLPTSEPISNQIKTEGTIDVGKQ